MIEHACHWPECPNVGDAFMCAPHWALLSREMQTRVRASWQGDAPKSSSSLRVAYDVVLWIDSTFSAKPERDRRGKWERLVRFVRDRDAARGRAAAVDKPPAPRAPVQLRLVP